jgi:hypothetical protein
MSAFNSRAEKIAVAAIGLGEIALMIVAWWTLAP